MKLIAVALILGLFAVPSPARADSLDTSLWTLAGIQITDAVQTQTFLHGGRFACNNSFRSLFQPSPTFPPNSTCVAIEADPFARPFVGNLGRNIGSAIVINAGVQLLVRTLFRHSRSQAAKAVWLVDGVYAAGVLVPNQRIIDAQRDARKTAAP